MQTMTQNRINIILRKHEKWKNGEKRGGQAIFSHRKLDGKNFSDMDLSYVNFNDASLVGANFKGSSLDNSIFKYADLRGADLRGVTISLTDFREAKLDGAKMYLETMDKAYLSQEQRDSIIIVDDDQKEGVDA